MSEKRKNTDRREAFQLAIGSTNRPAGGKKNDSYPAVRNYSDSSEWQYQWGFFIWIFIFSWQQRKQKSGQKDIERFRINIKMRKAGKTTHGPFSLAFLGLGEPKHDAVIYISISSSSVPSQTRDELSPEQDPSQKAGLQTVCGNVPLTTTKPPPPPSPPPPNKCVL